MDQPRPFCPQGEQCQLVRRRECKYWHLACPNGRSCAAFKRSDCGYHHHPSHYSDPVRPGNDTEDVDPLSSIMFPVDPPRRRRRRVRRSRSRSPIIRCLSQGRPQNDRRKWERWDDNDLRRWMRQHHPRDWKSQSNLKYLAQRFGRTVNAVEIRIGLLDKERRRSQERSASRPRSSSRHRSRSRDRARDRSMDRSRDRVHRSFTMSSYQQSSSDDDFSVGLEELQRNNASFSSPNSQRNTRARSLSVSSRISTNSTHSVWSNRSDEHSNSNSKPSNHSGHGHAELQQQSPSSSQSVSGIELNLPVSHGVGTILKRLAAYYRREQNQYEVRNLESLCQRLNDQQWDGNMLNFELIAGVKINHFAKQLVQFKSKYGGIDTQNRDKTLKELAKAKKEHQEKVDKIDNVLRILDEEKWGGDAAEFERLTASKLTVLCEPSANTVVPPLPESTNNMDAHRPRGHY